MNATWDAGNRLTQLVDTQGGTITRVYDSLNRLTQETTALGQVNYGYDDANRRKQKTVTGTGTGTGTTTSFVYDGLQAAQEIKKSQATNLLPDVGLDELIARTDPCGTVRYFLGDFRLDHGTDGCQWHDTDAIHL